MTAGAAGGDSHGHAQTTILVVEDEESFIDALTVGLQREGFRVQVARDGAQALDLFDAVDPDLVLLDVMLPEGLGHRRVPRAAHAATVPIIMVTAKGAEIDTVVGLEVGADDYVTKPYRLRELVARMRAVLRRARRGDRGRRADGRRTARWATWRSICNATRSSSEICK